MHFFFVPTSSSSSPSPANTSSFSLLFLAPSQIPENLCKSPAKIHIGTHGISGQSFLTYPPFSSKNTSLYAVVDRSSSSDIAVEVNTHYSNPVNRSRAVLKRVYFGNMWTGTATVAATLLLLMTLTQTVASIIQVLQN